MSRASPQPRRRLARLAVSAAEAGAGIVALVLAWAVYLRVADVPAFLLPAPASVLAALAEPAIWPALAFTLRNILAGFTLGAALGMATAAGLAAMPRAARILEGPILFAQTAPKIALAPLFVIWFGLGIAAKLVLIVSLVAFPVLVATLAGLRAVEPRLRDVAAVLGLSRAARLRAIDLPGAASDIMVGLRIGAVQAVVGAVLGEWMSGREGLGALMTEAAAAYRTPLLFAAVLMVVAIGLGVHLALGAVERRVLAWRP